jgi:exonuclease III
MKLTSWNIRGLNDPLKVRTIKNLIQMEKPQVFFLQETKCTSQTVGPILSKTWPGCHSVAVDASGGSGSLAIAWDPKAVSIMMPTLLTI